MFKLNSLIGIHTNSPYPWVVRMVKDLGQTAVAFQVYLYFAEKKYYWQETDGMGGHIVEEVTDDEKYVIEEMIRDGIFVHVPGTYEFNQATTQCDRVMITDDVTYTLEDLLSDKK